MSLLSVQGLTKSFPGVRALEDVDFDLEAGEVHALLGENGAGKSTLIKVLAGALVPDAGRLSLDGEPLPTGDPRAARRRGISVVHQELSLVPALSAAENIFLGRERGWPLLRRAEMARLAREQLQALGADIPVDAPVGALSVAQQQMVEIARALVEESRVLILDEPSATLTDAEIRRLFRMLQRLKRRGLGVVYISHRLEETFEVADRVTVLRDGRRVVSCPVGETDRPRLIHAMVGRDVSEEYPARAPKPGDVVLRVRALSAPPRFSDVSFEARAGEIVGLAGLVGAGRTSVALSLFGALPASGEVVLGGERVRFDSPQAAIAAGIGYVTEDRKGRGLFPLLGAGANITMSCLDDFTRCGLLSRQRERAAAQRGAQDFDLRAASLEQSAATLSGGNQQKLLLARYLLRPLRVLILDEPTRGIDVGARAEIYRLIDGLTREGLAILMISSDLPEVLGMSDRVVVMRGGRTTGELARAEATPERVMELATA